jgi:hypothetical protein
MDTRYKISSQSTNASIRPGDTLIFNAILFGNRDYLISLCTLKEYYPISFKITDKNTDEIIYDNFYDFYSESVGFFVDKTRFVKIEVRVLADKKNYSDVIRKKGCIGLIIQYKVNFANQ